MGFLVTICDDGRMELERKDKQTVLLKDTDSKYSEQS
jgi:hypothetical protein